MQEELERYFLEHQEASDRLQRAEAGLKRSDARWQRLYLQMPNYVDWERIEVVSVAEQAPEPYVHWRVIGLHIGPRAFATFEFHTRLIDGHAVLAFAPGGPAQPAAPLLRWPLAAQDAAELRIQPLGSDATLAQRLGVIMGLAASDWVMTQVLVDRILLVLEQPMPEGGAGRWPRQAFWAAPLQALRQHLQPGPAFLRYDRVELIAEDRTPGEEYLAIRLHLPRFANRAWAQLAFRIGGALSAGALPRQPRLELFASPAGHLAPLEAWQPKVSDGRGQRVAIGLDLDHGTELGSALIALSDLDWQQLKALFVALPTMLAWLKKDDDQPSRPWPQWLQLVGDMANLWMQLEAVRNAPPTQPTPAEPQKPATPQALQLRDALGHGKPADSPELIPSAPLLPAPPATVLMQLARPTAAAPRKRRITRRNEVSAA